MGLFASWLFATLGFMLAARLLRPDFRIEGGIGSTIFVAALFGILNAIIGGVLFFIIGIGTLGVGFLLGFITRWVVNAIVLKLTDAVSSRLHVNGFVTALFGAGIIGFTGAVGEWLLR